MEYILLWGAAGALGVVILVMFSVVCRDPIDLDKILPICIKGTLMGPINLISVLINLIRYLWVKYK